MEVALNNKIETQKPQVLYILGGPGSGKGTQCERLVRDFKYEHISVGDVMRAEINRYQQNQLKKIKSGSKEGQLISSLVSKGAIVPTDLTVSLLLKAIKSKKSIRFLIDGFPRGIEQALQLEKNFREIDYIINLEVPEDILVDRLTKRAVSSGRSDDNPETIRNRIKVFNESTQPVLDTYWRRGRVGTVSGLGDIGDIYNRVKQTIQPNLIFLFGAPSTGKSLVGQQFCQKTGYRYLSLQNFYETNKCNTDIEKINKLIKFLGDSGDRNFVIDSFLENKALAIIFFEHFCKPRYVVYFQLPKDEVESNIRKYSKNDGEKKQRLQQFQQFLKNRDELLSYFQQFQFLKTISAHQEIKSMVHNIIDLVKPQVIVALPYNNTDLADKYIIRLEKELGYIHVAVDHLCDEEIQRGTSLGNQILAFSQAGQNVPAKIQVELLRNFLFYNPQNNKYILTHFPDKQQDFDVFEKDLFHVNGLINFMKPEQEIQYSAKSNAILHYLSENRCININNNDIDAFKSFIIKRTKFGIVFGPQNSGRTTLSKYISQKYGYNLIEWEPTITQLKEKLGQPGEPLEDLPLQKIVDYFRKLLEPVLQEKYIFDGFPPGCENKTQIDLFLSLGKPTWMLGVGVNKDALWKRYKIKNELDANQEIQPEDDEKISLMIQNNEQNLLIINQFINSQADCKLFQIDANNSLEFTQRAIDYIYQKRVFLARSLLPESNSSISHHLKLVFINVAAQRNMTFIDVEHLISQHHSNQNVKSEYLMRWTDNPIHHPSNFSPELVIKLIQQHLQSLQNDRRDVLLWGYPSADSILKQKQEETLFPRATDEIVYIEKHLGPIRIAYVLTQDLLNSEIADPEWELKKPEEKVVLKADGDQEDEKQDQPADEGEDNKPKFNIYEYKWTNSDSKPKNIAQIYSQMKNPQTESMEVSVHQFKNIFDHFCVNYQKVQENINANFFIQVQINN